MNGDLAREVIRILVDPYIYIPILCYIAFVYAGVKVRKEWKHWGLGIVCFGIVILIYTVIMGFYVNHTFVDIIKTSPLRHPGRASIAVLCFGNVTGDTDIENDKDCTLFRHALISSMRRISGEYGIDMVPYRQIIDVADLKKNVCLTRRKAVKIGRNLHADNVIFGEISPIKDILISVMVVKTEQRKNMLEFQMRRRIKRISALARKASEEILFSLREIPEPKKKVVRDRLSARKTSIPAEELFKEGLDLYHRGEYSDAISPLKKAIEKDPNYSDAHYLLAFIYFFQKKDTLAIQKLKSTIKIEPYLPDPHYFLGVALKRNGRYEEACTHYKIALGLQERFVDKMIYKTALAGTLLKMGMHDKAQEIIIEVEETETKHRKVLYNLAARYCELNQLEKALSLLRKAIDSGLSRYDCKAALGDPDFDNFKKDLTKYRQFKELLKKCE